MFLAVPVEYAIRKIDNAIAQSLKFHSYISRTALDIQGREMRKYAQPPARARGTAGITADYLEAVEAESDYDDDGMTASNRARKSLLSRDRLDEQAEVPLLWHAFTQLLG